MTEKKKRKKIVGKKQCHEYQREELMKKIQNNPGLKFSAYLDAVIDMNGTTDFLEIYGEVDVASGGTPHFDGATNRTYFGAYRIGA